MYENMAKTVACALVLAIAAWTGSVAQDDGAGLRVTTSGVGTGIEDRELTGQADRFPEGTQVVFWTRVEGGAAGDTVDHVWIRDGEEVVTIGLSVGSPNWRTWSRKTLHRGAAGDWRVEARDREGRVLASAEFTCEAAPAEE
jgi:hypothetical protein